jgi:hypothetical protein
MLQILINNQHIKLGHLPQDIKINCLEFQYPQMFPIHINPSETLAWADYLWNLVQLCDEESVIIHQGVLMNKNDVQRYGGK